MEPDRSDLVFGSVPHARAATSPAAANGVTPDTDGEDFERDPDDEEADEPADEPGGDARS